MAMFFLGALSATLVWYLAVWRGLRANDRSLKELWAASDEREADVRQLWLDVTGKPRPGGSR